MHNKVVYRAAKAAIEAGMPALRFNFRGVGASEGEFANGAGEHEDARSALDWLAGRFKGAPIYMMGFSFGAWVGLGIGSADPRVTSLAGLGLPTVDFDFSFLRGVQKPKLILQGSEDQFGERRSVQAVFDSLAAPKKMHWVEGADHFFTGRLDEVQKALAQFLAEL